METFIVTKVSMCFLDDFCVKRFINKINEMLMIVSF